MHRLPVHGATGKFTWRMLATVLMGQSIVVFFGALVARALAATGPHASSSTTYLLVGSALAILCLVAAGMLRGPIGLSLGWLVQVLTLASALVVPGMLVVGVIFLALWITCLVQGRRIDAVQSGADRVAE